MNDDKIFVLVEASYHNINTRFQLGCPSKLATETPPFSRIENLF